MDAIASEQHFLDHLAPVWTVLPPSARGRFLVDPGLVGRARAKGIVPEPFDVDRIRRTPQMPPNRDGTPALVASIGDIKIGRRLGYGPFAFIEHGAGQAYGTRRADPSYSGGKGREDNELFLVPNDYSANLWRAAYPDARVEIVGCPKLDSLPPRDHSIGVRCDPWEDLLAAIQTPRPTSDAGRMEGAWCVAHAIASASLNERADAKQRATDPRSNTTESGTFDSDPMPLADLLDRVRKVTAALTSAMSRCTSAPTPSCPGRVISADLLVDSKWLFDGTLQRMLGVSASATGVHSLRTSPTTSDSARLAIPCTTVRAAMNGPEARPPVVAISFHWDAPQSISGYAGSASGDFLPGLQSLADRFNVIGHAHPHPGWPAAMERQYAKRGIRFVPDFEDVCRQADVFVADNTSALFEYAATGRPVVVLNAVNWVRARDRDPDPPGLRFWEAADVGIQVDRWQDLNAAVDEALADPPHRREAREAALGIVYPVRSGGAFRAERAITEWLASRVDVAA